MREKLQELINKLEHPLVEVQLRSVKNIQQKLEISGCTIQDLLRDHSFISKMLALLNSGSVQLQIGCIDLLVLLLQDIQAQIIFQSIGGNNILQKLKDRVPSYVQNKIDFLMNVLYGSGSKEQAKPRTENVNITADHIDSNNISTSNNNSQEYSFKECDDANDSNFVENDITSIFENPILFMSFPWVPLTDVDLRVLDSTGQALASASDFEFNSILYECENVLFKDYPIEIFLQRPFFLKVLLGHLIVDPIRGEEKWRLQESVCHALSIFTRHLISRLKSWDLNGTENKSRVSLGTFIDESVLEKSGSRGPSHCCSRASFIPNSRSDFRQEGINQSSIETLHESDDSSEFMLLKVHQLTVIEWCCQLLLPCFELLKSTPHLRLSTQLLSLAILTMKVLRSCLSPQALWFVMANCPERCEQQIFLQKISSSILQGLCILSKSLVSLYQDSKQTSTENELEIIFNKIRSIRRAFLYWINVLSPEKEVDMVFGINEVEAFKYLLSDALFCIDCPRDYENILDIMNRMEEPACEQAKALMEGIGTLRCTKNFLETSSSDVDEFVERANSSLPILFIHRSRVFVEKIIRGLAKQISMEGISEFEASKGRKILIQILSNPHEESRLLGYNALKNLVMENVGISQASNTSRSRSVKILLLLHPRIIRHLIYSGCADENIQIKEASNTCLLSLIRGNLLMTDQILEKAVHCFHECLLDLQNLVASNTHLGRAILNLPYDLSKQLGEEKMVSMYSKFYLKCLFNKDKTIRQESLRKCLSISVTSPSEYIGVTPLQLNIEQDCNLFALNSVVDILSISPANFQDKNNLNKILSMLSNPNLEKDMMETCWTQLTFILRNPSLHSELDIVWPIAECVRAFNKMMKSDGKGGGYKIFILPYVLEVVRLRATFSLTSRQLLSEDANLLLSILRICLFFRGNDNVRLEASILLSLLLYESIIIQKWNTTSTSFGGLSVPHLVSTNQNVPFIHMNYNWPLEFIVQPFVKTLITMTTQDKNCLYVNSVDFLKLMWINVCAGNDWKKIITSNIDFASTFSSSFILSNEEKVVFRYFLTVPYALKLLNDVENSTTHRAAKQGVVALIFLLTTIEEESDEYIKRILDLDGWNVALARFFLCYPTTALDKQVLYHILCLLNQIITLSRKFTSKFKDCNCCHLIALIANEFSKSDGALSVLLKETGTKEFDSSSLSLESFQSLLLSNKLLILISEIVQLSTFCDFSCQSSSIQWQNLTLNLSLIFKDIIRKCKSLPKYNLCILIPALDSFLHLLRNQKIGETSLTLVPVLIDLLMCFHIGRGKAHNAYLGRSVSVRSLLLISFIVGKSDGADFTLNVINAVHDEIPNLPWLLSALEHWDPVFMIAGLKVVISLSSTLYGACILDDSLSQIPGGIWTLIMRYYVRRDLSPVVQILSAYVLLNLTSHIISSGEENKPWRSLSLTDTVTKKKAVGEEALLGIIVLFDLFGHVRYLLKGIRSDSESLKHISNLGIQSEELQEFVSSEESEWTSSDTFEDVDTSSQECLVSDFPDLLAVSLQMVYNLLCINHQRVSEMLSRDGIGKVLVRQIGLLTNDVKTVDKWNLSLEVSFKLLRLMGKPFCNNTHLSVLAVNTFNSEYPLNPSLKRESINLLSCMVSEGGWGSFRVLELLRSNSAPLISFVVECLHERNAFNASAAAFIGSLGEVVTGSTPQTYVSSLRELLDSPLKLQFIDKEVCPGWEFCRHLIQLLPEKMKPSLACAYYNQFKEDEENVKLFLEALKILLLISKSARKCAFFRADVLLKLFSFSLTNLNENISNVNIHITSNIMNRKELKNDFLFAIHCLQVSTNWVIDSSHEGISGNATVVGECLIPLLHPLWFPALRAPPFIEAVVQFLIMISSHVEVCPVLTRTSIFPGALLSGSRTRNSLLVLITSNVTRLLERKKIGGGKCLNDCGSLPKDLLEDALDLLVNCGRVHESAYVVIKEGFIKTIISFLEFYKDLNSTLAQKIVQCLTILTLHKEARTFLAKLPSWVKCMTTCLQSKVLRKNVLLVLINMIANVGVVKNMLSTEDFLPIVATLLVDSSKDLTAGIDSHSDAEIHLCMVVLWALAANNQRCKTILKRLLIKSHIENLYQHFRHPILCLKLIAILNS